MYLSTEADVSEPMDPVMELHPIEYIVSATMKGVCVCLCLVSGILCKVLCIFTVPSVLCMNQGVQGKCITNKATPTRTTPFSKEKELT